MTELANLNLKYFENEATCPHAITGLLYEPTHGRYDNGSPPA